MVTASEDLFELEELAGIFGQINNDITDCSSVQPFTEGVCHVGDTCCKDCSGELADTLDCLLNNIVAPFITSIANISNLDGPIYCPVPEDCQVLPAASRRGLMKHESNPRSHALPELAQFFEDCCLEEGTTSEDNAQFCVDKMAMDTVTF